MLSGEGVTLPRCIGLMASEEDKSMARSGSNLGTPAIVTSELAFCRLLWFVPSRVFCVRLASTPPRYEVGLSGFGVSCSRHERSDSGGHDVWIERSVCGSLVNCKVVLSLGVGMGN